MYRFATRPLWILSHVLVAALVVTMVSLGYWQVRRYYERVDRNQVIRDRTEAPVVPWASAVFGVSDIADGEDVAYTPVSVTGRYRSDREFVVVSRTQDGAPGRWVVTPLVQSPDGPEILVVRGFIPLAVDDVSPPIDGVEPPDGDVEVQGWLRPSTPPGTLQGDRSQVSDHEWARVDIAEYRETVDVEVAPVYVQLAAQAPANSASLLTPVPLPELTSGPHVGYAAQWFIFSTIAAGGYLLILRKTARRGAPASTGEGGDRGLDP